MKRLIFMLIMPLFFISCASVSKPYMPPIKDENAQKEAIFHSGLLNKKDLSNGVINEPQNGKSNLSLRPITGSKSAPLTIINPYGSSITVWALAPGNWLWGYTLDSSKDFGDARTWQVLNLGSDIALISNLLTKNCIHDEGSGITHRPCDINNKSQQWQLFAMDNGAVQLKSTASGKCIRTEFGLLVEADRYFSITMEPCSFKPNIDQQWIFVPEAAVTAPLLGGRQ